MSEWQDISSAPKDGTTILGAWRIHGAKWARQPIWFRGTPDKGGRWMLSWDASDVQPTHWMPLPSPPEPTPTTEGVA